MKSGYLLGEDPAQNGVPLESPAMQVTVDVGRTSATVFAVSEEIMKVKHLKFIYCLGT